MEEAAAVAMDYINSEHLYQRLYIDDIIIDLTQHLTTFLPRFNTSSSRSSTRRLNPKVTIWSLI
jgi:hypothetical protein